MNDYIKNFDFERMKPLGIAAICFTAVFIAGFGAGKLHSGVALNTTPPKRTLSNYTTNTNTQAKEKPVQTNTQVAATPTLGATTECAIKGSKSKMYHVPGGSFYDRTNADKCFATESEAQAAGYTKSSR